MNIGSSEYLTAQFYAWEQRGRGWKLFDEPVELESEFIPFFGHHPPMSVSSVDSGRLPRFFPRIQEAFGLFKKPISTSNEETLLLELENQYPIHAYKYDNESPITELQINFNKDTRIVFEHIEQLLLMLSTSESIVSFELLGTPERTIIQFACSAKDASKVTSYITAFAPDTVVNESRNFLNKYIEEHAFVIDLGLRDEFMRPLRVWNKFDPDPLSGCIGALESLEKGEFGMIQILFQPAINPWAESIARAITDGKGGAFFADASDMLPLTKEKISCPLFSVVIRAIGQAEEDEKSEIISKRIAQSLIAFHRTGSNTLIPLGGAISCDLDDVLCRRSRRIGMILNSNELASMVHIPDRSVVSPKLRAYIGKTKSAPAEVLGHAFELGINTHLGQETRVTLSDQHRLRHMHVIGATGSGKSTLLLKLIIQDIEQMRGLCVLDPHGDLIEEIIKHIPVERLKDVVLVDPSDTEYPIGLNLLSANTDAEKIILSSDMVALFRRFATSWGDQMTSVLTNAITAIVESPQGGTFIDLRRFLAESHFRNKFLATIKDPSIQYYWKHEFKLLRQNSVAPILTRLDTFLRPRILRNMMAQKDGLDFREILDSQKILLVKLSQGLIGEENSYLLGTLFVSKLQQAAQSRQNLSKEDRSPFFFYIDEFQNFITPSMSAILSGARKYGLGLILAHQDLDQLTNRDKELANSVLSNPAIRVCFRCGDKDAKTLESSFSYFDASDLQSLKVGQAIARVSQKNNDFNLSFPLVSLVDSQVAEAKQKAVTDYSRSMYGVHYQKVEDFLHESLHMHRMPEKESERIEEIVVHEDIVLPAVAVDIPEKERVDIQAQTDVYLAKEEERQTLREHRSIQEFIKRIAEARNFKAVLEEPINDYSGKVDVSLHRDDLKIACEISVKNTVAYEVKNIQKCLLAEYPWVFMISDNQRHLHDIRESAISAIDPKYHSRMYFVSKEEFVTQLDAILAHKPEPTEVRAKGYRVKFSYGDGKDQSRQDATLKDVIFSALRRQVDKGNDNPTE